MTDRSARSDEYLVDVSESDLESLARDQNPVLLRAVERVFRETVDTRNVTTRFNSSI